jgi:type I restriction enzyme, S subunit
MSFEVSPSFETIPCSEYCQRVADGTHDSPKEAQTGKLLVTSKNVKDGRLVLDSAYLISDEDYLEINRRSKVDQWDLLLTMIGTVGEVCVVEHAEPSFAIKNVGLLKCGSELKAKWLYYFLRSPQGQNLIEQRKKGSTQQYLSLTEIRNFPVSFPANESEMHAAIASLSVLDDRITLLHETNATLEAIAQALFKSWFVDFDPVRAKLEGRAPEGMDEATAALFPDSFEESELGLVPRGWRVGTLADLSRLNPESWTAKNHPEFVAYVDLANAKDNEIASVTDFEFDEAPSRARRVLRDGDTIVGTVRPGNRSFAFIHEPASNLTASTGFAVLRPSEVENTEFVYLAATQDSSIEHLAHVADGGAYPAVRPDVVSGLQVVVPDAQVLKAFHAVAISLLAKVSANQKQAQTLATLRDTLLPRLISGQLRLPQTETILENA